METVAFRLPSTLKERIEKYAETIGESKSVAGRQLLRIAFDSMDDLERVRAENERLSAENDRLQEKAHTNQIAYALMIVGAFLLGGAGSVTIDLFGQSAGVIGIVLILTALILSYVGIGRLTRSYSNVFER